MGIKDFLVAHYGYIIAIIVLIIITIIGFLADKKGKDKNTSKDILPNNNPNMGNVNPGGNMQQPMNYQPTTDAVMGPTNNIPAESANNNVFVNPMVNNAVNPVMSASQPEPELNVMPGTMQGTIVNNNVNQMSAPTQPVINPIPLEPAQPAPISQVPVQPVNPMPMYQPAPSETPVMPAVNPINNMQNYNQVNDNAVPNMEPINQNPNLGRVMSANNVNPAPIPTPVQPVQPVPIPPVPAQPVNPMPMPNTTVPNQVTTPQPVNNGQFNFVYGNQQSINPNNNNNGFMQ